MPAKDIYHDTVIIALEKDGWKITDDQLKLTVGNRSVYVDLGAEKLFAAEKEGRKIAVEIKSFIGASLIRDLEEALGQYVLYSSILEEQQPERLVYLAVPQIIFRDFFSEPICQLLMRRTVVRLIVFEPEKEEITQWIH
ncbi:fdxN element excision controlling factor protein [Calothrix sp. NIES-4071]|nr:fdxN element excision controlling factor protein [Calothrix sp. NIES-4071]BAZ60064.1 fdxN element excision controlling factor protein [Calothrix sp. NIES-4105]